MAEDEHVEAILIWSEAGSSEAAEQWLRGQGLALTRMTAGLLLSGRRSVFETAFGVALGGREGPVELPLPRELQGHVRSVGVPKVRRFS